MLECFNIRVRKLVESDFEIEFAFLRHFKEYLSFQGPYNDIPQ
jgi:hypothetical protein